MSRILLVDDSPHAQRMGERILSDEGFEVVTVTTAESALVRLEDVDPDVVVADTVMPGRNGFDICYYLKISPRHKHVRVILTAGVLDALDEVQVQRVEADGTLRKPFEATALLAAVKPLVEAATTARAQTNHAAEREQSLPGTDARVQGIPKTAPFVALVDSEQVRAAVTVALDAAMGSMVEEISQRVVTALATKRPEPRVMETPPSPASALIKPEVPAAPVPPAPLAAPAPEGLPHPETVRRVTPVRVRSSSLLGLDLTSLDPPDGR
jgi:DNA-binding response OmpR family regulator